VDIGSASIRGVDGFEAYGTREVARPRLLEAGGGQRLGLPGSVCVVVCGAVLVIAGAAKVRDRRVFGSQIAAYELLPLGASRLLGEILPFAEIVLGAVFFVRPVWAGPPSGALFIAFASAIAINLLRGRTELVCGCFGARGRQRIGWDHLALNLVLAGLAAVATLTRQTVTPRGFQLGISAILVAILAESARSLRSTERETHRLLHGG